MSSHRTHVSKELLRFDPTSDILFKYLFEAKTLLIPFLNHVLHLPEHRQIIELTYQTQEQTAYFYEHRGIIFDIKVEDQEGRIYEIEIQRASESFFLLRGFYYGTRLIAKQLKTGDTYFNLKPTVVLLLTTFDVYPDDVGARVFHMTPYQLSKKLKSLLAKFSNISKQNYELFLPTQFY